LYCDEKCSVWCVNLDWSKLHGLESIQVSRVFLSKLPRQLLSSMVMECYEFDVTLIDRQCDQALTLLWHALQSVWISGVVLRRLTQRTSRCLSFWGITRLRGRYMSWNNYEKTTNVQKCQTTSISTSLRLACQTSLDSTCCCSTDEIRCGIKDSSYIVFLVASR